MSLIGFVPFLLKSVSMIEHPQSSNHLALSGSSIGHEMKTSYPLSIIAWMTSLRKLYRPIKLLLSTKNLFTIYNGNKIPTP